MKKNVLIVDYGCGNVGSLRTMLSRLKCDVSVSSDSQRIAESDLVILPGVGKFQFGMANLESREIVDPLMRRLKANQLTLGICLGAQLLCKSSEESPGVPGLGFFDATVHEFNRGKCETVPHMGWNKVNFVSDSPLQPEPRYYFIHSYYMLSRQEKDIWSTTRYGDIFHSALRRGNVFACQFHPEKSHRYGMSLLENILSA